jgi:cell volume regulation protein A
MRITRREDFSYAVMLAILFLIYSLTESFDGSGPISVFVAGFAFANSKQILRRKDSNRRSGFDPLITRMHSSISFLIRTFFFVYVGAIVFIDNVFGLLIGVLISVGFLAVRPLIVGVVARYLKRERKLDKRVMVVMFPRGLSAAILAVLPYSMGIPNTEAFADIVFTIIIGTTIITTIGIMAIKKFS